jgi:hypothetical protein
MNADQTNQPADPNGLPEDKTASGPSEQASNAPDKAEREQSFTRRALLQWSVPVIVAAALPQTAQAQTSHGDTTTHNDGSTHGDSGLPHSDHGDGPTHGDTFSHGDGHNDNPHSDGGLITHNDSPHFDSHNDFGVHNDFPVHADGAGAGPHSDNHGDGPAHSDASPHSDTV